MLRCLMICPGFVFRLRLLAVGTLRMAAFFWCTSGRFPSRAFPLRPSARVWNRSFGVCVGILANEVRGFAFTVFLLGGFLLVGLAGV